MTRCAGLARFCDNSEPKPYRLRVGLERPIRRLCDNCRDTAASFDYEPQPIPEWQARQIGKDLTGALVA
jgi:hypothetical protein